jgi:hypothetical protein
MLTGVAYHFPSSHEQGTLFFNRGGVCRTYNSRILPGKCRGSGNRGLVSRYGPKHKHEHICCSRVFLERFWV